MRIATSSGSIWGIISIKIFFERLFEIKLAYEWNVKASARSKPFKPPMLQASQISLFYISAQNKFGKCCKYSSLVRRMPRMTFVCESFFIPSSAPHRVLWHSSTEVSFCKRFSTLHVEAPLHCWMSNAHPFSRSTFYFSV